MTDQRPVLRGSSAVGILRRVQRRLWDAIGGSRLLGPLRRRWPGERLNWRDDGSAESDGPDETPGWLQQLGHGSRALGAVEGTLAGVAEAATHSRLSSLAGRLKQFVGASWLYRWLTAEPEPDVVVIDLRETLTVGPWLAAADRAIRWLLPATVSSVLFRAGHATAALVRERPVQVTSVLVGAAGAAALVRTALADEPSSVVVGALALIVVLAVLGSRDDRSWAELRETRWAQWLAAAFEPPEPPDRPLGQRDGPTDRSDGDGANGSDAGADAGEGREQDDEPESGEPD